MKARVFSKKVKIKLPKQFEEEFRPDLIKRAVVAKWINEKQPKGTEEKAGKKKVVDLSKVRRDYKSVYGRGRSRTPRKTMMRRGSRFRFEGAFAPFTKGGYRAHPPKKGEKGVKVNKKERRKAIRSAIAATANPEAVKFRGHITKDIDLPIVLGGENEDIKKTQEFVKILEDISLEEELERVKERKIRSGKGKMRGRKYKEKVGPLVVVSEECPLMKAARNIPGVDVCKVDQLNASKLAPGAKAARLTIWTTKAIKKLEERGIFR